MEQQTSPPDLNQAVPAEYVFYPLAGSQGNPTLQMAGAVALSLCALICFVAACHSNVRVNELTLQVTTTLPFMAGIGMFIAARDAKRAPAMVSMGPYGIRTYAHLLPAPRPDAATATYPWETMGWCKTDRTWQQRRVLYIYDPKGKVLVKLTDGLLYFDYLVQTVEHNLSLQANPATRQIRTTKARRMAVVVIVFGLVMLAGSIFLAITAQKNQQALALLQTTAVRGQAQITRRFLAPNGVTPRLEYRIVTPDGKVGTRDSQIPRDYYDYLERATHVPVIYVPSDPNISRLVPSSVDVADPDDDPATTVVAAVVGLFMTGVLITIGVLSWKGWEMKQDPQTGKISFKRIV